VNELAVYNKASIEKLRPEDKSHNFDSLIEAIYYDIGALKETLGDEASNTVFVAMMMDLPTIEIFLLIQSKMIAVAVAFSLFS
jgi:hypothetical protein